MDKIELFNRLARIVRPAFSDYVPIESLDTPLVESGLDSMDALMFGVYMGDIYGVPDHVSKEWVFVTPRLMFELFEKHATRIPATVDEALKDIQ